MGLLHLWVLILLLLTGVPSDSSEWGVNYTEAICAVRGSNVIIPCSYSYPNSEIQAESVHWCSMNFSKGICPKSAYFYNSSSTNASEGFQYAGDKQSNCTLLIRNVQFSHSAEYKFRFIINNKTGRWTGQPGVTLKVGALQVIRQSENGTLKEGDSVNLTCAVNCSHSSPQFVWFKDSERLPASGSVLHLPAVTMNDSGRYSCAFETDEAVRSETLSINVEGVPSDSSEWGVNYTEAICAVRGSNVTIPCSYSYPNSEIQAKAVHWCSMNFSKGICPKSAYFYNSSSPYASDVFQYAGDKQSNCTLLIRNVQFSHSAVYKFRFITKKAGKWTGEPGVTLEVGALLVIRQSGNGTLKEGDSVNLTCDVNCSHSYPQFVWFKDSERLPTSGSILHLPALTVDDSGNYSCALETDETLRSETLSINVEGFHALALVWVGVLAVMLASTAVLYKLRSVCTDQEKDEDLYTTVIYSALTPD